MVGALVALFSLPMTAYGIVLARREPKGRAGQAVTDTVAGGRLVQVRDVRGNLRVGAPPSVSPLAGAPAPAPAVDVSDSDSPEGQVVRRSRIGGAVHQIDGVGDDADIDR